LPKFFNVPKVRKAPRLLWLGGLAVALAITLATASSIRNFERLRNEASFQAAAVERIDLLTSGIEGALSGLVSLGAYFDAAPDLDRAEFFRLAQPFLLTGSPIQALEWVPRVPLGQRLRYVQAARHDGNEHFDVTERAADGTMVAVPSRAEYFPVFYVAPVRDNEKAIGFDLASNPARRGALERAYATGQLTATGRVTLVQERSDQYGFLAVRPVFRGGSPPKDPQLRRTALAGFVLGVFRIGDIVNAKERSAPSLGVEITLDDDAAEPGAQRLFPKLSAHEAPPAESTLAAAAQLVQRKSFRVAGRIWTVAARPSVGGFVADHTVSNCVLVLGCLISALWALYLRRLLQKQYASECSAEQHMAELQRERNFNEAILSAAGALIIVSDRDAQIVRFNRAAEEFTGYSFAQVQGQPHFWNRFRLPHDQQGGSDAYEDFRAGRQPSRFERVWQSASGEQRRFDWTVSTISDAHGAPQYLVALGLDITVQKRLEETAREQESRLRTILENLAEGVCTLDARGQLTYLNARAQAMLGWTLDELADHGMLAIMRDPRESHPESITSSPIYLAMQKRTIYRSGDEVFYCKDGSRLPVKVSSAPCCWATTLPAWS
jgi:PAS domain S-box-containing protein